jgi:hypothetical protein
MNPGTDSGAPRYNSTHGSGISSADGAHRTRGISAINKLEHNGEFLGCFITRVDHSQCLWRPCIDEGSLAHHIVAVDKIGLIYLDGGINRDCSKSGNTNIIIWLLPVSLFALGIICIYHGAPRRSFYGFLLQVCACFLWVIATIVTLSFWFEIPLARSIAISPGVSATCYRGAENIRIVPVVIAQRHSNSATYSGRYLRLTL